MAAYHMLHAERELLMTADHIRFGQYYRTYPRNRRGFFVSTPRVFAGGMADSSVRWVYHSIANGGGAAAIEEWTIDLSLGFCVFENHS